MARVKRALPVVVVVAFLLALMYPVALLLGMPLARARMGSVSNWVRETVAALPVADADAGGERLPFGGAGDVDERLAALARGTAVVVRGSEVLAAGVDLADGAAVLPSPLAGPAAELGGHQDGHRIVGQVGEIDHPRVEQQQRHLDARQ